MAQRGIPLSEFFRETLRALNEQGLTDRAIHEAGGPAEATLTNWRTKPGLSARRDSLDKLDTALRWPKDGERPGDAGQYRELEPAR